ncbi:MAG: 16S rRNA (guanine(966)-N(2))-methyltransferase RsmD [Deltaproteobacteria bacterium]|nr:16S rRNA (guanine(966)-N(2))-methyltransferase RsmD [Deltaproteobacteria bacterium]
MTIPSLKKGMELSLLNFMRVIAGSAKGHRLQSPQTLKVRPATDKVKGALFNILGNIEGLKVLDLFAGTGSVGIEALSRGAATCHFVEADRHIATYILKNLSHCHFENQGNLLQKRVDWALKYFHQKQQYFDLIFVDPPYDQNLVNPTLKEIDSFELLSLGGWIVVEHSPRENILKQERLEIFDERSYGQTRISFLKRT